MKQPKLVNATEAAKMLGWTDRKKVHEYTKRGTFPAPVMRIGNSPVWSVEQIESYMKERGIES